MTTPLRIVRAIATNQLARIAPRTYIRMTRETGRGARESETPAPETPEDISNYFQRCVEDYFEILGISTEARAGFLQNKSVLEYGPGDLPGVALLLIALGAEKVYCVDRFALVALSDKNKRVIDELLLRLPETAQKNLRSCFNVPGSFASGFSTARIEYLVRPSGLSQLRKAVDVVLSRAVLEHVDDLAATFRDMVDAMKPGALAVHKVDLKSHGLHRSNPLDFLNWSTALWTLMFSHKGAPNRFRVDRYRDILTELPVEVLHFQATGRADAEDVLRARPHLARQFRDLSDEDLSWLGFWLAFAKRVV